MKGCGRIGKILPVVLLAVLIILPMLPVSTYIIHVATLIFIWSIVATTWSFMGRFGLVSLGHGAFMGMGKEGRWSKW